MEKRFEGKVALVTGAASGMGKLLCRCFAEEGAMVAFVDIDEKGLAAAICGVENALPVVCDVRDFKQVEKCVKTVVEAFGTIDYLVNMAGGSEERILNSPREFCDQPIEVLDWGLDVNLRAQIYFDHEVTRVMREHRTGVIVHIGSQSGIVGTANATYGTAKSGAMVGLTRSMAIYGAKYGFRSVSVAPGPVLTRTNMANMPTLLGRAAEPREVVDLILYLCSDKAAFITGECVVIDGGRQLLR